ncbi:MAG: DsbA family protein [Chromatiaceae bacterium]|jgi:putative protein-disulfide isomerase|nr:DsbA family protein [Chromatiaceae bacterium]
MPTTLYYIHDPMCSWCWGFRPTLGHLLAELPAHIEVVRLLGGLAPDTDQPMPQEMRLWLEQTWCKIAERIPGTKFNHDFWTRCTPRRSTYPACRAVIAARRQDARFDEAMTLAIQRSYYLEARNPSDRDTLVELAEEIGADAASFTDALGTSETQAELEAEIEKVRTLGSWRFPSLVLELSGSRWRVPVDYLNAGAMLETIALLTQDK